MTAAPATSSGTVEADLVSRKEADMRMAELSRRSGVPIQTIRYYQREGLLPAGQLTSPNQAVYDESHVRRLGLIRAMVEVGEMPIAAVRALFQCLEANDGDEFLTLGLVQYALVRDVTAVHPVPTDSVDDLLNELDWRVRPANPARNVLAAALGTLERLGQQDVLALLKRYATAVHELAETEVRLVLDREGLDERAEAVVTVGVLGDAILTALRKLAQEDVTTRMIGAARNDGAAGPTPSP
ncbi:MerR family transcriptional regulator [Micromonospora sp. NPDC048909]|uniref:MerR family transcriptional regulator n=1 Tax=Micromonospora sp. NPDC048909 TaxID=3155643 RepID=UPI0033E94877